MKWLVYYSKFFTVGKGDPDSKNTVIGYSDLNEQELFVKLQRAYPTLPIRKVLKNEGGYGHTLYDHAGKEVSWPYKDCIFFVPNTLKQF